jgi:hypothetical protein
MAACCEALKHFAPQQERAFSTANDIWTGGLRRLRAIVKTP